MMKKIVRVMTSAKTPIVLMGVGKDLTTGQVGIVCGVSPKTVKAWVDSGEMTGSYTLPDSKDRRVSRENLIQFMVKKGMSSRIPKEWGRLAVLIDLPTKVVETLSPLLAIVGLSVVCRDDDLSVLGSIAVSWPELVIVSTTFGRRGIAAIPKSVRAGGQDRRTFVIVVYGLNEEITPDKIRTEFGGDRAVGYWQLLETKVAAEEVTAWLTEAAEMRKVR